MSVLKVEKGVSKGSPNESKGDQMDHAPDSDPSNEPISDGSDQGHFGHFMRKQVSVTRGARNSAKVTGLFNGSISSTVWRIHFCKVIHTPKGLVFMELYGRAPARDGSQSDPSVEWSPVRAVSGLEESMWRLGLSSRESYPERPGVADCVYYMKTGFCGFGSRCRYNHPRDRSSVNP
ncbi:Zinc finger CCCH domain-containing protein 32 [Vitis vinifera]|uniref:Zinc finger CCCH domain-containing protein 32 n=1 Tax=Vitis vinifera TaxID=29760 RepID=A0A438KHV9_VITVI|nr:Zinc finger CCCH domain-containing protein 32 [Vitis vinifera]